MDKLKPWLPFILLALTSAAAYGAQMRQVLENKDDIKTLEQVQIKQVETKKDIEYIQKDIEALNDDMEENKELLLKIWQKLGD